MNAQLERCYSKRKRKPRPRSWGILQFKSCQKKESQPNTEKEWPMRSEENQENVGDRKISHFKSIIVVSYQVSVRLLRMKKKPLNLRSSIH